MPVNDLKKLLKKNLLLVFVILEYFFLKKDNFFLLKLVNSLYITLFIFTKPTEFLFVLELKEIFELLLNEVRNRLAFTKFCIRTTCIFRPRRLNLSLF